jgi:hypothetical protein
MAPHQHRDLQRDIAQPRRPAIARHRDDRDQGLSRGLPRNALATARLLHSDPDLNNRNPVPSTPQRHRDDWAQVLSQESPVTACRAVRHRHDDLDFGIDQRDYLPIARNQDDRDQGQY